MNKSLEQYVDEIVSAIYILREHYRDDEPRTFNLAIEQTLKEGFCWTFSYISLLLLRDILRGGNKADFMIHKNYTKITFENDVATVQVLLGGDSYSGSYEEYAKMYKRLRKRLK